MRRRLAEAEVCETLREARRAGRAFVVHFVRSSYLLSGEATAAALAARPPPARAALPALLLACSAGVLRAAASVPQVAHAAAERGERLSAAELTASCVRRSSCRRSSTRHGGCRAWRRCWARRCACRPQLTLPSMRSSPPPRYASTRCGSLRRTAPHCAAH